MNSALAVIPCLKGGIDNLLRQGRKVSPSIQGLIDFDNTNAFFFEIKPSQSNKGYIEKREIFLITVISQKRITHSGTERFGILP